LAEIKWSKAVLSDVAVGVGNRPAAVQQVGADPAKGRRSEGDGKSPRPWRRADCSPVAVMARGRALRTPWGRRRGAGQWGWTVDGRARRDPRSPVMAPSPRRRRPECPD